jgi:peptidyl-prolyl cis-trans isomerase B (cyclophilin B)
VASKRDRQRQLERARTERRIARQAEKLRRRRQTQAAVGAGVALLLIVVGVVWLVGGFSGSHKPTAAATCTWHSKTPNQSQNIVDTGHPPATGEIRSGTVPMTIKTNLGEIDVTLNRDNAPCTVASFAYLAGKQYFDGSTCHRLTTGGIFVLQCGDPTGTGSGSPAYTFADEYVPPVSTPSASASPTATPSGTASPSPSPSSSSSATAGAQPSPSTPARVVYQAGTVAMAHSDLPDSNGSQFFIVYRDSVLPDQYTVFGQVSAGLDIVQRVAKAGAVDPTGKPTEDGKPRTTVSITSLTVGTPPTPTGSTPEASSTGTATPATPRSSTPSATG